MRKILLMGILTGLMSMGMGYYILENNPMETEAQAVEVVTPIVREELSEITAIDLPYKQTQKFIDTLMPYAKKIEDKYGIPAKVIVAQACVETGWGKRIQENNILGIGHTVGKRHLGRVKRNGKFVKLYVTTYPYASINDCLRAYAEMISNKPNYRHAMANRQNYRQYIKGLQRGGYCKGQRYEGQLNRIINKYDFD